MLNLFYFHVFYFVMLLCCRAFGILRSVIEHSFIDVRCIFALLLGNGVVGGVSARALLCEFFFFE